MTTIRSRLDAFIEQLREDAKCSSGNKPCGKICIPKEKNCGGGKEEAFSTSNALTFPEYRQALDEKYDIKANAKEMAKKNPRMTESIALNYYREAVHIIETQKEGNMSDRLAAVNSKYDKYFA